MRLKVINKKKVLRNVIILLGVLISFLLINNNAFSHQKAEYKLVYVSNGDTLWNIAKQEQEKNKYYEGKDIREIMENIKQVNNLSNSSLKTEQKLNIPTI